MAEDSPTFIAFLGQLRLAEGPIQQVALAAKAAHDRGQEPIMVFDDTTGRTVELDLRGSAADVTARLSTDGDSPAKPGRGRPKLGVTAREVTLLPRHWDWLSAQPGGAQNCASASRTK